jgi:hypothetical protein
MSSGAGKSVATIDHRLRLGSGAIKHNARMARERTTAALLLPVSQKHPCNCAHQSASHREESKPKDRPRRERRVSVITRGIGHWALFLQLLLTQTVWPERTKEESGPNNQRCSVSLRVAIRNRSPLKGLQSLFRARSLSSVTLTTPARSIRPPVTPWYKPFLDRHITKVACTLLRPVGYPYRKLACTNNR